MNALARTAMLTIWIGWALLFSSLSSFLTVTPTIGAWLTGITILAMLAFVILGVVTNLRVPMMIVMIVAASLMAEDLQHILANTDTVLRTVLGLSLLAAVSINLYLDLYVAARLKQWRSAREAS